MHFCEWAYFMTFYVPKKFIFTASDVEIEDTFIDGTFIGGGALS
jgi:hypothetical protein